jgi:hypothetical protein
VILYSADLSVVHAQVPGADQGAVIRYGREVYRRQGLRVRGAVEESLYVVHRPARSPVSSTPPHPAEDPAMAGAVPVLVGSLVDPIGSLTNLPFTPGGAVRRAVTPDRRPTPRPAAPTPTPPRVVLVPARVVVPGPRVPLPAPAPGRQGSGAGSGADVTKGLARPARPGKTLLT